MVSVARTHNGGARFASLLTSLANSERLVFGAELGFAAFRLGSGARVRDFRMQPFTRALGAVVGCHPPNYHSTTVAELGLPRQGRRTSSSEVDLPFAEEAVEVSFRQLASFGRPKSNGGRQS